MTKRRLEEETEAEVEAEEAEEEEPFGDKYLDEEDKHPRPPLSFGNFLSKYVFSGSSETGSPPIRTALDLEPRPPQRQPSKAPPLPRNSKPSSPKPKKKRPKHTGYAPPSKYAHLLPVPDSLSENLICVFIGINPGLTTAQVGHSFANPTNLFWPLLHSSGCTPDRRLRPQMDQKLPQLYSLGQTNIVKRPTKDAAELSKEELLAGVAVLKEKVRSYKPEAVCFVGKVVWESVFRVMNGRGIKKEEFEWGWQDAKFGKDGSGGWEGCRVFVAPSTSGLVAAYGPEFKKELWKKLGDWVQMRRRERGEGAPKAVEGR